MSKCNKDQVNTVAATSVHGSSTYISKFVSNLDIKHKHSNFYRPSDLIWYNLRSC